MRAFSIMKSALIFAAAMATLVDGYSDNAVDVDGQLSTEKGEPHSIRVEVYYEVLCPDSRYFILHQLYPTWQKISDIMEINFKPFGKASYQQSPRGYMFKCQHGPGECQGNMVHACAIKHVAQTSLLVDYIKCMITDNYDPKAAGSKCAESMGINWSTIEQCVDGREGQDLLAMHGDDTHSLRPKISFVPTILLDGSQKGQKDILKNLLLQVCRVYNGPKPDNCIETV